MSKISYPPAPPQDILVYKGMRPTKSWPYRDRDKNIVFLTARYDLADGSKDVIPWRPNTQGGWEPKLPDIPNGRPLLVLPKLLESAPSETVYIVEGEKKVAALISLGLLATTSSGGGNAAAHSDWSPLARFHNIVIMPDNDTTGEKYATDVVELLAGLPGSRHVDIARLPGLPEAGDVVDWLQARCPGWNGFNPIPREEGAGLREELLETIGACAETTAVQTETAMVVKLEEWPVIQPLKDALRPVPAMDGGLLPGPLRPFLTDVAHRMQCPLEYVGVNAMVLMGGLMGRKMTIRPRQKDDWSVYANMWGVTIGPPSSKKSPAQAAIRKAVDAIEIELGEEYAAAKAAWKREVETIKIQNKAARKAASKNAEEALDTGEKFELCLAELPEAPVRRRLITSDATVEKLAIMMAENPNGLTVLRDELVGWMRDMDKPGRESSRAFYLESSSGDGRFTVDRVTRDSVFVDGLCLSILGNAVPDTFSEYISECMCGSAGGDGLVQRFQMAVWPDPPQVWESVDQYPNQYARDDAYACFRMIHALVPEDVGAQSDKYSPIPYLRFSDEAQAAWNEYHGDTETRARRADLVAWQSYLGKQPPTVASLALLCHLIGGGTGPISLDATLRALAWAEFLEEHAKRIYLSGADEYAAAKVLLSRIKSGDVKSGTTVRDIADHAWTRLRTPDDVRTAAAKLSHLGYLKVVEHRPGPGSKGGRPSVSIMVNPSLETDDEEEQVA